MSKSNISLSKEQKGVYIMNESNKTILGVFAHPDDEFTIAGLLTRARKRDMSTHLICATRGEAGTIQNIQNLTPEEKGKIRSRELKKSCEILGVSSLNFMDLGDSKSDDWSFDEAADTLISLMKEIDPDIIITFDKNGGNGHPDHKAICRLTVDAFNKQNTQKSQKLYHLSMFPETFGNEFMGRLPLPESVKGKLLETLTVPDEDVTSIVALEEDELVNKFKLLDNYKSQFPDENGQYYSMPLELLKKLTIYECYYLNDSWDEGKKIYSFVEML